MAILANVAAFVVNVVEIEDLEVLLGEHWID